MTNTDYAPHGKGLSGEAIRAYNKLQAQHSINYIIYTVTAEEDSINVLKTSSSPSANYSEFLSELPDNECRYGAYSFSEDSDHTIFVLWLPDGAKEEQRELYQENRVTLERDLIGLKRDAIFVASDKGEIAEDVVKAKIRL